MLNYCDAERSGLIDTESSCSNRTLFETIEDLDHSEETMRSYLSFRLPNVGLLQEQLPRDYVRIL